MRREHICRRGLPGWGFANEPSTQETAPAGHAWLCNTIAIVYVAMGCTKGRRYLPCPDSAKCLWHGRILVWCEHVGVQSVHLKPARGGNLAPTSYTHTHARAHTQAAPAADGGAQRLTRRRSPWPSGSTSGGSCGSPTNAGGRCTSTCTCLCLCLPCETPGRLPSGGGRV